MNKPIARLSSPTLSLQVKRTTQQQLDSIAGWKAADRPMYAFIVLLGAVTLGTLVTSLGKWYQLYCRQRQLMALHECRPPRSYPHIPFLFGLDLMLEMGTNIYRRRFAEGARSLFETYGTTHVARLGYHRMVNTIDPENLETILRTNFDDYTIIPGREKLIRVLFGKGVFATTGHEWKASRILVRRAMATLDLKTETLETCAKPLIKVVRASKPNRSVSDRINFGSYAFNYTITAARALVIGTTAHEGAADPGDQFAVDFTFLGRMARVLTIMIMQIPYLAEILYGEQFKSAQMRVFDRTDTCIRNALRQKGHLSEKNEQKTSLVAEMVRHCDNIKQVRSEALNLLLAGHDTVGIALSEMFYCLAREPQVWAKLRDEVRQICPEGNPTVMQLKQMEYLSHIINEAIRVRPTLSVHGRRAIRDTILPRGGGLDGRSPILVPSGTYVVYSNYSLYRNASVFGSDVDRFRPERWAEISPRRYEYLPFGAGPRNCPGKEMGWVMLAYITARLAQEVELIQPRDDRPWQEARAFSFFNQHGVHVAMKPAAL